MKHIVVVEDNPDNRLLLRAMLDHLYRITEFETGAEGLAGIPAARPDAVLLDVSLPGMDGLDVVRALKADPATATIPIIALTAHAMAGDRERFIAAGFDDYLTKPIMDDALLIETIVRHAGG